jgi:pilus assembly protein CpaC
MINSREVYLLGKSVGSTNIILWAPSGQATVMDVAVTMDVGPLRERFEALMPQEKDLQVSAAADAVVLSGRVSDATQVDRAVALAEAYVRSINRTLVMPVSAGDAKVGAGAQLMVSDTRQGAGSLESGTRVVNMLGVMDPQQVMLEVKIAEVSKTLIDKLGANLSLTQNSGSWTYSILSNFLTDSPGTAFIGKGKPNSGLLDAQKQDGLIKVLAEPNIMAISGQKGSFLAGGKVFIPVARTNDVTGVATITLEEREFGVGVTFTPTVLSGGRINLAVAPEVSELQQSGTPFATINGVTSVLPSFTVRRAETTVQLRDGQSFAIGGLIKNNVTETVKAFPALGEIPILGALFRSSEFQRDRTELLFVVTPRLVKPLPANAALPTDGFVEPSRTEFFLGGKLEGSQPAPAGEAGR